MNSDVNPQSGPSIPLSPYPWQQGLWQRLTGHASERTLAHAYLIGGESGIGKRDFAMALASFLLCPVARDQAAEQPAETRRACGKCRQCLLTLSGNNPDLKLLQPEDSAFIRIAQIRELGQFIEKSAHSASGRVIILDPAEALNTASANALLKNLEEPPAGAHFLLISDAPVKVLTTIKSRCQLLGLPVPPRQQALEWLDRFAEADEAESVLALARGRPLSALRLLSSGELEQRRSVLQRLGQLFRGEVTPVEVASQYRQTDVRQMLDYFTDMLSSLIRLQLLASQATDGEQKGHKGEEADSELSQLLRTLGAGREVSRTLFAFHRDLSQARREVLSGANPNSQLVLEDLFWRWQRMGAPVPVPAASTAGAK